MMLDGKDEGETERKIEAGKKERKNITRKSGRLGKLKEVLTKEGISHLQKKMKKLIYSRAFL